MLKIVHFFTGLTAVLLALVVFVIQPATAANATLLACIGFIHLLLAPLPSASRQGMQQAVLLLLLAAAVLQAIALFVTHPGLPAASLLLVAAATLMHLLLHQKPASKPAWPATERPQRIEADSTGERETGIVKWFNTTKGFGFISRDNGEDIFVHFRAIRGEGHRILVEGQRVEYNVVAREKGLQAEDVVEVPH